MVYLYLCHACENGNHGACELGHPAPPGVFGGDLCRCPCRGQADWNTPERIDRELRELVQKIMDHQRASEQVNLEVNCPPKKIELKKVDKKAP
jgi:hypothetical protein